MIIYIFDLDDTIIKHTNSRFINYNIIQKNKTLNELLQNSNCEKKYIFTNGTKDHANLILNNMDIKNHFNDIFSRNNFINYMKPHINSYLFVEDKLKNHTIHKNKIFFFDDQLINLKIAKIFNWITILIHADFLNPPQFIDYSFPNIYQALLYLNKN